MGKRSVLLVAVQPLVDTRTYADPAAFRAAAGGWLRRAAAAGPLGPDTLVVLPEDVGLFVLLAGRDQEGEGAGETVKAAMKRYIRAHGTRLGWTRVRHRVGWPRALLLDAQARLADVYFNTLSTLARDHGVYLVAGSTALTDATLHRRLPPGVPGAPGKRQSANARDVYNVSVVFGPDGQPVGVQRKCHLIDLEGSEGLDLTPCPSERLVAIDTPLGRLGIAICFDAFHGDVLDRLEALGIEILVQPSANPVPWEPWQQAEWLAGTAGVMEARSFVYGLNPMLNGRILDLPFAGQSAVLARGDLARELRAGPPLGYRDLPPREPFLAVAPAAGREAVIRVRVPHPHQL